MNTLVTLVERELREAVRNRWLIVYACTFAVLAGLVGWGGAQAASITGSSGFGPVVAQFVALVMLFAPLMGLTLGAQAIVRDRERGILAYMLAQPITRAQYFCAKLLALALELAAAVLFGFAVATITMGLVGAGGEFANFAVLLALTWLLTFVMGAVGLFVSVSARRAPAALGIAVALWLAFTVFGDLGIMATALATRLGVTSLLSVTLLNPVEAFKIAVVAQLSASLDALGPGGQLAADTFGGWIIPVSAAAIALWLLVPASAAWALFRRQDAL